MEELLFKLTNKQRKYLGLIPVEKSKTKEKDSMVKVIVNLINRNN